MGIYTLTSFLLLLLVASAVQHMQLPIGHPFRTPPTPITNELVNKNGQVVPTKTFYTNMDNDGMEFFQALGYCYHHSMNPALITSPADETILWNFLNYLQYNQSQYNHIQYNTRPFWLSLNDIENEGTFEYVPQLNATMSYINWAPNSPVSLADGGEAIDCVSAQQLAFASTSKKFGWINLPCNTKWRPLCQ